MQHPSDTHRSEDRSCLRRFGTFRNPKTYERETVFYQGASRKIADMLLFRDVTRPAIKPDSNNKVALESS